MNIQRPTRRKKAVNLTVDAELLEEARAKGHNLSKLLHEALRRQRAEDWKKENAEAIKATNERIDREGLWTSRMKVW